MEIYLIRHGATFSNEAGRYSGSGTDDPLSPAGLAEAKRIAPAYAIRPERIYVSPMRRAVQTAETLFPGAALSPVAGLREMHFGVFEGRGAEALSNDPAYAAWLHTNCIDAPPGGESWAVFSGRVYEAFSSLVAARMQEGAKRLVTVSHGGVIMAVMARYADEQRAHFYDWHVGNCRGYRAELAAMEGGVPYLTGCRAIP